MGVIAKYLIGWFHNSDMITVGWLENMEKGCHRRRGKGMIYFYFLFRKDLA